MTRHHTMAAAGVVCWCAGVWASNDAPMMARCGTGRLWDTAVPVTLAREMDVSIDLPRVVTSDAASAAVGRTLVLRNGRFAQFAFGLQLGTAAAPATPIPLPTSLASLDRVLAIQATRADSGGFDVVWESRDTSTKAVLDQGDSLLTARFNGTSWGRTTTLLATHGIRLDRSGLTMVRHGDRLDIVVGVMAADHRATLLDVWSAQMEWHIDSIGFGSLPPAYIDAAWNADTLAIVAVAAEEARERDNNSLFYIRVPLAGAVRMALAREGRGHPIHAPRLIRVGGRMHALGAIPRAGRSAPDSLIDVPLEGGPPIRIGNIGAVAQLSVFSTADQILLGWQDEQRRARFGRLDHGEMSVSADTGAVLMIGPVMGSRQGKPVWLGTTPPSGAANDAGARAWRGTVLLAERCLRVPTK